jgi:DNA mismatch endonuclease (patch repair protein)
VGVDLAGSIRTLSGSHAAKPVKGSRSASWASSAGVRACMQSNRPRDTKPEVALRSALHRRGLRFFKHTRPIAGLRCEPDVVFPRIKLAVFIDGCFWHGCTEHKTIPRTNRQWWEDKIQRTRDRDRANDARLTTEGWRVLRFWEHETLDGVVISIAREVSHLRR